MSRKTRLLGATASALAVAAVAVAPASGGATYSTHLTLSQKAPAFHGKVFSPGGAICKNHRTIKMLRVRRGKDRVLGTTTSRRGRWFVNHPNFPSGEYYAKATRG